MSLHEHDERASRDHEREARHAERDADREARRAERRSRRHGWGGIIGEALGERIRDEIQRGIAGSFPDDDADAGSGPARQDEVVEHRFTIAGMPRVTARNVSGETDVAVGEPGEVFVRARKRVHGWSAERAKRLLENVEIRFEQDGDDILIEPRLFEQERSWLELFRGGRVAVDLDIRVPRETHLDVTTVSGDLSVKGTRGHTEVRSVSGDVEIDDVQGPLRVRTVSGDVGATAYAGRVDANSTSGEIRFVRSQVRAPEIVTMSGDVEIGSLVAHRDGQEGRVKTVSGDIELSVADPDLEVDFLTVSGDVDVQTEAQVEKQGRRDRRILLGRGTSHLRVKTVSGDLTIDRASEAEAAEAAGTEDTIPMGGPEPTSADASNARDVLDRLARGEISVDDAAAALDAALPGRDRDR